MNKIYSESKDARATASKTPLPPGRDIIVPINATDTVGAPVKEFSLWRAAPEPYVSDQRATSDTTMGSGTAAKSNKKLTFKNEYIIM